MHREILKATNEQQIDHINGNKRDNRKCNLRFSTQSQNAANQKLRSNNKTGFKGVWFDKTRGKYSTMIMCNGIRKYLGRYKTAEEAYEAYKTEAQKLFGEFTRV